jgi:hypothetical protein
MYGVSGVTVSLVNVTPLKYPWESRLGLKNVMEEESYLERLS